jgi:uncharacterized membrane protein
MKKLRLKRKRCGQCRYSANRRIGQVVSRECEMIRHGARKTSRRVLPAGAVAKQRENMILSQKSCCLRVFRAGLGWFGAHMLSPSEAQKEIPELNAAELGAIAHLYRGEVYRSTIWRTRLDNTTNWSIVTMGIALSTTFSSREASSLPLILIGMLLAVFLGLEARRYRYFNVWRARARYMETHLYAQILSGKGANGDPAWRVVLAEDYLHPRHHISFFRAAGRRVRRTYIWIIVIQTSAYFGKLAIHPAMAMHFNEFVERAEIGPIPGWVVLCCGLIYNLGWVVLAIVTYWLDRRAHSGRTSAAAMG